MCRRSVHVRVIEAFVEALDLSALGFAGINPHSTGRPAYHTSVLLKLYIYGYLNRINSSRRLERETQRNVELMWLIERTPGHGAAAARFIQQGLRGDVAIQAAMQLCADRLVSMTVADERAIAALSLAFHSPGPVLIGL